jgi:hypothetical protein
VSGSQLFGGAAGWGKCGLKHGLGEVRVWGLETLVLQHTLLQSSRAAVSALAAVEGRVWAGVGGDMMVVTLR